MKEKIKNDIKKFFEIQDHLNKFWESIKNEEIEKLNEVCKDTTKNDFVEVLNKIGVSINDIKNNIEEVNSILNKRMMKEDN